MFNKIMVPLDGSKSAEAVLPYVEEFGRKLGSEIHLLHVCTSECGLRAAEHKNYLDSQVTLLKQNMTAGPITSAPISVLATLEEGNPNEIIEQFTIRHGIDLVALTNNGTSNHETGVLGRVADHITRTTRVPALLVKPGSSSASKTSAGLIQHLLLPLDGSDLSKLALPAAQAVAESFHIPITLFQMAREIYPYYGEAAPFVDYQKMTDDEKEKVEAELTALQTELTVKGFKIDWNTNIGSDAAHEIIELIKKIPNCLIVMSTHGRSGIGRWAFGSVADKVIHYVAAPLLLVPAKTGR